MKVLLTGGRGLIGRWAVDELARAGHEVVSVVREQKPIEPELHAPTEELTGDAGDPGLLRDAMRGVDGVVHLAAIPYPVGFTARELLAANTLTTATVLEAAGEAGVPGAVIASSVSVLGMAWSEEVMPPLYLPVDESHPMRPTEGYALSKQLDEAVASMAARRWDMSVFALRFPFTQTADGIRRRVADPDQELASAKELWSYLDVRDAARAVRLALEAAVASEGGEATVMTVMADDVSPDGPLKELVGRWYPGLTVPPGLRSAYDLTRAEAVIGFRARHLLHP